MRKLSKIIFEIFGTIYSSVFIIFLLLLGLKRKIFIGYVKTKKYWHISYTNGNMRMSV